MPNDPGQFDFKITIESRSDTLTDMGAKEDSWSTIATVWAKRYDRIGRPSQENDGPTDKISAETITDWNCYYSSETSGVAADDRITWGGQVFEIISTRRLGLDIIQFTTRLYTNG